MRQTRLFLAAAALGLAAACATPPDPGPPFADRLAAAIAAGNPYQVDAALTGLLADTKISPADRADALYRRGDLRRQAGDNRRGAVEDMERALALAPEDPRATQVWADLEATREEKDALETRLGFMLTLPQWFDVAWMLGERDAPALRYQASGLSPNEWQTRKLQDAGFLCGADGAGGPAQGVGDTREWLADLTWCDPLPVIAAPDAAPAAAPEEAAAEAPDAEAVAEPEADTAQAG